LILIVIPFAKIAWGGEKNFFLLSLSFNSLMSETPETFLITSSGS
jgi:hypothetical protein